MSNDGPHGNKGLTADDVIHILDLAPHPEGGHFRETFRDTAEADQRAASSAIYFLLEAGEQSRWHVVDAAEAWHFYAGDALLLETSPPGGPIETLRLGPRLDHGERPQAIVPRGIGSEPEALAHGRSSAARSRPVSHSMASRSPLRISLLICRRGGVERRRSNSATSFERYPPVVPILNFCARGAMAFNPRDNCRFGS